MLGRLRIIADLPGLSGRPFGRAWRLLVLLVGAGMMMALAGCQTAIKPLPPPRAQAPSLDQLAYAPAPAATGAVAQVTLASDGGPYRLDSGDRLRIVVYGQEGLSNSYSVDAGGMVTMPLIGAVRARGLTPAELAQAVAAKLRAGYIREPYVAAEVEVYRPFFILGEVQAPGQYPYVPNMTVESAVAIAGGFTPRARRDTIELTRIDNGSSVRATVPRGTLMRPGDTVVVAERWF